MGLFDDLKKTALGKIVDTIEKNIENKTMDNTRDTLREAPGGYQTASSYTPSKDPQIPYDESLYNRLTPADMESLFDEILATEFSALKVIKNAAPESIGISAPKPCRPYNYALMRNGKPALLILITARNRYRNSAFLNAKNSALKAKVSFLNFGINFPNLRGYVVNRIKNAL